MSTLEYYGIELCRVCLTNGANMFSIKSPLRNKNEQNRISEKSPSILNALEQVMSQKLCMNEKYPSTVCQMCKSLLTIAYDLNVLFFNSQRTLNEMFKNVCLEEIKSNTNVSAVDLIIGNLKFSLDDILIVEDEKEENKHNFDGFLRNLGTTISAVFVKNLKKNDCRTLKIENSNKQEVKVNHLNETERLTNLERREKSEPKHFNSDKYTYKECSIKQEIKKCHPQVNRDSKKRKQHLCDICGHLASNTYKAKEHRQTHFGKTFQCPTCPRNFYYKISLELHKKTHKNSRDYLCSLCGKTFLYSSALVYHMRMHTNERNFVCDLCEKKFYMQSTWKRHMRIHTNDRPYVCTVCNKGFRSNGEKKKHEMIHTGLKPHKCRFCEKKFSSKYNLFVHYMSHTGEHACDYCPRTFIDIEFLKRHIYRKHSEETIVK